jgi:hypothetical protein
VEKVSRINGEEIMEDLDPIALAAAIAAAQSNAPPASVNVVSGPDLIADLTRGVGLAGRSLAQGAAGIGGLVYDPLVATQNYLIGSEGLLPLVNDIAPLRQQVSQILTSAGVPEPSNLTERIIGAISEGMVGSAGMAGVAKGAANLLTGAGRAVSSIMAAQPGAQIVAGGTSGLGAQGATEAGAGPVGQFLASLAGGIAGGRAAGLGVAAPQVGLPAAIKEAEQAGVRVMTTDVRQPTTFAGRWLQRTGEMIPIAGTGGLRAAQQQERIDASVDLLRNYGVAETAAADNAVISNVAKDLLAKRSADLTKYTGMKNEVIERLSQPNVTVPVPKAVAKIDEEIARLNQISPTQFKPVIDRLITWRDDLTGTREIQLPNGQKQVVQQGQPLATIEVLRKQIGESFTDQSLASVRKEGEQVLNHIYAPLREDMGDFIKANGQRRDFDKWSVANKQLKTMVGDLEVGAMRNALDKGDATPEAVRSLLFSTKPSDIRSLYRGLSADGKRNARTAVLQEAFTKVGGEFESLSPDQFKRQLVRLGAPIGVFFSGQDLKAVEDLVRTLKMTERAGQAAVSPPTGVQAVPIVGAAVLTDLLGGAGAAVVSGVTIGGLARAYESAAVRNLLLKIPQVAAGSAEEAELFKRLTAAMNAQKASESEPRR